MALRLAGEGSSEGPHQEEHQAGQRDALAGPLDANARVAVRKNGGPQVGSRRRLNFTEGANITLTVTDDPASEELDVTIAASGGGGSGTPADVKESDALVQADADPLNFTHGLDVTAGPGTQANIAVDEAELDHALLGGVTQDQHHPKAHAHDGLDGSGTVAHGTLTGAGPNDHHPQDHQARHQSGAADALTGNLDATARVAVRKNSGANVGARRRLNLIEGSGVTLTLADDPTNEEVDVTIAATGGGGGGITWNNLRKPGAYHIEFTTPVSTDTANRAINADTLYAVPFIGDGATYDAMEVDVTLTSTGNLVCGIYQDNGAYYPGDKLAQWSVEQSTSTAGRKQGTLDSAVTLANGTRYWLAFYCSATPSLRSHTRPVANMGIRATSSLADFTGVQRGQAYNPTMPTTFPTGGADDTGNRFYIGVRKQQ